MKKPVIIAMLSALVLLTPAVYYAYYGLVRKEHFYRGLTLSYFDKFLNFVGLRGKPAVLNRDDATFPVIWDLIWSSDTDVRGPAISALAWKEEIISGLDETQRGKLRAQLEAHLPGGWDAGTFDCITILGEIGDARTIQWLEAIDAMPVHRSGSINVAIIAAAGRIAKRMPEKRLKSPLIEESRHFEEMSKELDEKIERLMKQMQAAKPIQ